jgi:hypothetical protein
MTKTETIKNNAIMILSDIAFVFQPTTLIAYNMKNIQQTAVFRIDTKGKRFLMTQSSMSNENTYKSMLIVERNKDFLYEEWLDWVNTQTKVV